MQDWEVWIARNRRNSEVYVGRGRPKYGDAPTEEERKAIGLSAVVLGKDDVTEILGRCKTALLMLDAGNLTQAIRNIRAIYRLIRAAVPSRYIDSHGRWYTDSRWAPGARVIQEKEGRSGKVH